MAATVGSLRIELSANIAQFQTDMGKAASAVKATAAEFTAAGNDFKKIGSQLQGIGLALSKTITLPLVAISAAVFKVGTDFEDAFAGVKKTVEGTPQQLQAISDAFRDMSKTIPTSATDLAKIGEIAGQMGVSRENIVEFTKTISQIATATHLTAEEAASSFGKIAAVMKVPQSQFESLGSAVYALGNFGNSTEQEMLGMAQRIAAAGATVGMTSGQVLGLSNALASAGIQVEAGGTAMSKLIFMMGKAANDGGKALEGFAKVAGQSAEAFKTQFGTDAAGAVVAFVEGLKRIKDSGGNLIGTIEALGIKQSRLRDSTISLALAGDLVRASVDLGTKAFSDHTGFVAAVEERYKTTSNQFTILRNRIDFVGQTLFTSLKPAIELAIQLVETLLPYLDSMAKSFATLPGGVQLTIIGVAAFAAALGPAIWLAGQMVSSIGTLTLAFGKTGLGTRVLVDGLGFASNAFGFLNTAIQVDGAIIGEWGKGSVILTGVAAQVTTALQGMVAFGMLPLKLATEAEAASQAFYATVLATTSGALEAVSARLGLAAIATRAKAAAAALAATAEGLLAAAIDFVNGSALVMGIRMAASSIATTAMAAATSLSTVAVTALGVAIDVVQKAFLPLLALWAGWKVGSKIGEIDSVADAMARLVRWLDVFHIIVAKSSDKDFENSLKAQHQGLDGVSDGAKQAADQFKTLKDRISGALATHDAGELTKVVIELSNEGQLTGTVMRRVAVEGANLKAQGATLTPVLENIAKAFGQVNVGGGSNGFQDLANALKAARAELAGLSGSDLARLTEAIKSGAFSMKEIEEATGLSDMALKLFQGQVRDNAKELKAANSIFAEYDKQQAEAVTALTEGFSAVAPIEFIKKAFGSLITEVVEKAGGLGKTVPDIIKEGFLQITMKDATDKLQKEFVKFGEDMNAQAGKDMQRVNATVIKTLGVIVDAGNSTADSVAQFSIEGLKNEIKNLEATNGETKKSHDVRKQLAAEEYQYQVTLIQREAQTKKDALDATLMDYEDYNKAVDAIEEATAAKMGLLSQKYQQSVKENATSTKRWTDSLGDIASAFSAIASASSGAFSDTVKEIGGIVSALGTATKAAIDFQKATEAYKIAVANGDLAGQYAAIGSKVAAVANGIAAVAQATSSKSKAGAIVGGAITGAAVGSNPALVTATSGLSVPIGAGVGALVGWIRAIYKGGAEKAALDVGRDFGIVISEGLSKELADLGKRVGRQAADIFDLDKIIAEGGGLRSNNIQQYTAKLRDTFVLVKTGALSAADGAVVLDKNFANFANEFLANGPLISKDLVEIVRLTDGLGASSKAVGDFIKQQVTGTILPGLKAFAGASKDASAALADNQKKLKDLNEQLTKSTAGPDQNKLKQDIADVTAAMLKQQGVIAATAITSQGAADALSASVAVAFAEMMKAGTPIVDIVNQLEPVVDSLGKQFEAAGFSGGAAFDNIRSLVALAADEIAGPAIQSVTGLGQTLAGLSNIGQLTQGTFTGLTDQIDATFNSLIAQGKDGGQVLTLMQGPLQTIWQLSTDFGYAVDDGTKALLDQALAAGVVGEKFKGPQQQMIDALTQTNTILGSIAKALGATLPDAAKQGADGVKAAFKDVNPKVKVDIQYNDPGFTPSVPGADYTPPTSNVATGGYVTPMGVQHFDQGGLVKGLFQPKGTDTVPAMLTPGEVVLNQDQQGAIRSALAALSMTAAQAMDAVSALVTSMRTSLPDGASAAAKSIAGIGTAAVAAFTSSLDAVRQLGTAMGLSMATGAAAANDAIGGIPPAMDSATAAGVAAVRELARSMGGSLPVAVGGAADAVEGTLDGLQKVFADRFADLPADAKDAATHISEAFAKIVTPDLVIRVRTSETGGGDAPATVATGGYVTPLGVQHFNQGGLVKGLFHPQGTDTVPAMLTPGELVLNRDQQQAIAAVLSSLGNLGDGGTLNFLHAVSGALAALPNEATKAADAIGEALTSIRVPVIQLPVEYGIPRTSPAGVGDQSPPWSPMDGGASGLGAMYPHNSMASLHGSDGLFHDLQLADQRASAQPTQAGDQITVNLSVHATDLNSFRDLMNRPGGGNDMLIENIAQGKRGRDEKLRRALAFK